MVFGTSDRSLRSFRSSNTTEESIGSPHSFQSSPEISGLEYFKKPYQFRNSLENGSGKEPIISPQSSFLFRNDHTPSGIINRPEPTRNCILAELPVNEKVEFELPGNDCPHELHAFPFRPSMPVGGQNCSNIWKPSFPTSRASVIPSFTLDGSLTLPNIPEADSASIKELPCFNSRRISSRLSSITNDPSSHNFDFDTCMEFDVVDATAVGRDSVDGMYLMPMSSKQFSSQTPKLRQSMCPNIQTDVEHLGRNSNFIQRQQGFSEQLSSPETATTVTSGNSFSTDSGYGSTAPESFCTPTTSPGSFRSRNEQLEFGTPIVCKDAQLAGLSDFSYGNDPDQRSQIPSIQLHDFVDDELLDHFYAGQVSQPSQPASLEGVKRVNTITPSADQRTWNGTPGFAQILPEFEFNLDYFSYYAPTASWSVENIPWSTEHIRGFHWNIDFSTSPEAQLPVVKRATSPTGEDSHQKVKNKSLKCKYCGYEPGGRFQWRKGNLKRHINEKHEMKPEDRIVCDIGDCKETFGRRENLNTHKSSIHAMAIDKKRRIRRSMGERGGEGNNIKDLGTVHEFAKVAKVAATVLINHPKHNPSQSDPEFLDITEL